MLGLLYYITLLFVRLYVYLDISKFECYNKTYAKYKLPLEHKYTLHILNCIKWSNLYSHDKHEG